MNIVIKECKILLSGLLVILSCNKPSNPNPATPNPSNSKSIAAFTFKTNNNLGLTTDVNGTVGQDTITVTLPYGTALTNLAPTITFTGKTIEPSSGVAQDFTNPVTYTVNAEDGTTRKYVAVVSLQGLQGTIVFNTLNGESSPYPGMNGHVYALDAVTGTVRWQYGVPGHGFISTPALVNGTLYTGNVKNLMALDTATKAVKWTYTTGGTLQSAIAVVNGVVYSNCNDGYLYALDATNGSLRWKFKEDIDNPADVGQSANSSSPTVVNGVVYFGDCLSEYVYAVDAISGAMKWKWFNTVSHGGTFGSSPAVVNGVLYIGDLYGKLIALDANAGTLKWSFDQTSGATSPTVVNGIVYSSGYNALYALDAVTGVLKWRFSTPLPPHGSATVSNGVVYITADGGNATLLIAINANTGAEKWRYYFGLSDTGSPLVFGSNIYFAVAYNFFSIDANTGKKNWMFIVPDDNEEIVGAPCAIDQKGKVYYSSESGLQN